MLQPIRFSLVIWTLHALDHVTSFSLFQISRCLLIVGRVILPSDSNVSHGLTAAEGAPENDIDGESRPQRAGVDIGADEYLDTDGNGMPDRWELKKDWSFRSKALTKAILFQEEAGH
jgi:hypothetical protein